MLFVIVVGVVFKEVGEQFFCRNAHLTTEGAPNVLALGPKELVYPALYCPLDSLTLCDERSKERGKERSDKLGAAM